MASVEVIWLHYLLKELKDVESHKTMFFTDSINDKYVTTNPIMHAKMKHVEIVFHFIKKLVIEGKLDVRFTS